MYIVQQSKNDIKITFNEIVEEGTVKLECNKQILLVHKFSHSIFEKLKLPPEMPNGKITVHLKYNSKEEKRKIYI